MCIRDRITPGGWRGLEGSIENRSRNEGHPGFGLPKIGPHDRRISIIILIDSAFSGIQPNTFPSIPRAEFLIAEVVTGGRTQSPDSPAFAIAPEFQNADRLR